MLSLMQGSGWNYSVAYLGILKVPLILLDGR